MIRLYPRKQTPYLGSELDDLDFAQSGDTLIMVHPNHEPRQLQRQGSHTSWTVTTITFENIPQADFTNTNTMPSVTLKPDDTFGRVKLTTGSSYWVNDHVGTFIEAAGGYAEIVDVNSGTVAFCETLIDFNNDDLIPANEWIHFDQFEDAWSATRGYPRTVCFHDNRLWFCGSRDLPSTVWGSRSADFFDFNATEDEADFGISVTLATNQVHIIKRVVPNRSIVIFTSEGEFELTGAGAPISPTSIQVIQQSAHGVNAVPPIIVDNEIIFCESDNKEVRAFNYSFSADQYVSTNFTVLAHQLFNDSQSPTSMTLLSSFRNHQSNYVFLTRSDGTLICMTINRDNEVLAFTRHTTDGDFERCQTVTALDSAGNTVEALYVIVDREGTYYVEKMTNEDVFLDHFYEGTNNPADSSWTGATTLANRSDVRVVGDGVVHDLVEVNGSGAFTTDFDFSTVYAGLDYTSSAKSMPIVLQSGSGITRGERMRKVSCHLEVEDTQSMKVDGYRASFRSLGSQLLDQPVDNFTGEKEVRLSGISRNPTVTISVDEPLKAILKAITVEVKYLRDDS